VLPKFDGTDGLHQPADFTQPPLWQQDTVWRNAAAVYSETLADVAEPPRYIIEELAPIPDTGGSLAADKPIPDVQVYRVSARGVGGSPSTMVILQTTYRR
jgi:type IV pilus assembly protein PilX